MHKKITLDNGVAVLDGGDVLSELVRHQGLSFDGILKANIIPLLKQGDVVLDGGAALGDHTANYLQAVGPSGRVIAFEPCDEFYQCLLHNCPGAECHQKILWHERRDLYLNLAPGNMGGCHVAKQPTPPSIGPIATMVVDDLNLERLDFVKLDVEGAEFWVLLGMEKTIKRCRPKMVIEISVLMADRLGVDYKLVYSLLEKWGYDYYPICGDPGVVCDILALPRYIATEEETERMAQ